MTRIVGIAAAVLHKAAVALSRIHKIAEAMSGLTVIADTKYAAISLSSEDDNEPDAAALTHTELTAPPLFVENTIGFAMVATARLEHISVAGDGETLFA